MLATGSLLATGMLTLLPFTNIAMGVAGDPPPGHCGGYACDGTDGCIKDEQGPDYTITSPNGELFSSVWVKTGGDDKCVYFSSDGSDGCFIVTGIGTVTVTVTIDPAGTDCHGISHIQAIIATPTPTPTTGDEPTPTPGDDLTPTPSVEPTVAPTVTEAPQPTATPQPSNDSGGTGGTSSNDSGSSSSSSTNTETKQGQVLGTSTLAATGGFADSLAALSQILGVAIMTLGKVIYARKK